ncbi:MAG: BolA family transcriptional regulator [Moraxellaceae bacterium]|nr:MAG: BolA family transcriptional regulator [Moraxellaceae bacterium]
MNMSDIINQKITAALAPTQFEVINESHLHAGHMDTSSNNTHFRLIIVAQKFEGLRALQRHKMVYGILSEEMPATIHALALDLKSPSETNEGA